MVKYGILAMVLVLGVAAPRADAHEQSGILHRMSCAMVRYYVALYSATAAEQYARSQGASDSDIEIARRCIKSGNVQAAAAK
jgi:hypothetical protein